MKLFKFDWFRSPERKELEKLQVEEARLRVEILKKQLVEIGKPKLPFKKLIYNEGNLTVVTLEGEVISGDVDQDTYNRVKNESIGVILGAISPMEYREKGESVSPEELNFVHKSKHILFKDPDFNISGDEVYLKGVNLEISPIVLASFIELAEKMPVEKDTVVYDQLLETYEALKMFWRWTALCPIESSRGDLMTFIKENDVSITANGLLEMYRRVDKVGDSDKTLVEFISRSYADIRRRKKATGDYEIFKGDYGYKLAKHGEEVIGASVGNLKELYLDLPNMQENTYTDNYSHTKKIKIGEIYREDEDKIDLDNRADCSNGLHVGGRTFGFSGAGNTGVMVLVNPMKVRAVPVGHTSKMRVSEMFIVGLMDEEKYKTQKGMQEVADFSQEYYNNSVEELEEILKDKTYEKLSVQGNKPAIIVEEIQDITDVLKSRVVNI